MAEDGEGKGRMVCSHDTRVSSRGKRGKKRTASMRLLASLSYLQKKRKRKKQEKLPPRGGLHAAHRNSPLVTLVERMTKGHADQVKKKIVVCRIRVKNRYLRLSRTWEEEGKCPKRKVLYGCGKGGKILKSPLQRGKKHLLLRQYFQKRRRKEKAHLTQGGGGGRESNGKNWSDSCSKLRKKRGKVACIVNHAKGLGGGGRLSEGGRLFSTGENNEKIIPQKGEKGVRLP